MLAFMGSKQEDQKYKVSLRYTESSRVAWATCFYISKKLKLNNRTQLTIILVRLLVSLEMR